MPTEGERDRILTVLAILMGLMAVSNLMKPVSQALAPESSAGFVFLGQRLHGTANAVAGPIFGVILAAYAYGAWTMRRWVVPIALAYAVYVPVNLVLFTMDPPPGPDGSAMFASAVTVVGMIVYAIVAIGVSGGGAFHLHRNRDRLR